MKDPGPAHEYVKLPVPPAGVIDIAPVASPLQLIFVTFVPVISIAGGSITVPAGGPIQQIPYSLGCSFIQGMATEVKAALSYVNFDRDVIHLEIVHSYDTYRGLGGIRPLTNAVSVAHPRTLLSNLR